MTTQSPHPTPRDVDFLPASYREAGVQRKNVTLRVGVVALFVALIGVAAAYQQHLRWQANQQLVAIAPHYEHAKNETRRLAELQQRLQAADQRASLYAYLQHPWPRSQILAEVARRLPTNIELTELHVLREPIPGTEAGPGRPTAQPGEAAQEKLDPAQRDLLVLRQQWDRTQIAAKVSGITDDAAALHRYFEQLGRAELVEKTDIGTIERLPGETSGRIRFSVRLILRPSYGQPGGPTWADEAKPQAIVPTSNLGSLTPDT